MPQKTKPYYRFILEVKPGEVLTTKRGGGVKVRETDYPHFKPGDLCRITDNRAYPLEYPIGQAPKVLTIT